ncbi:hypothetical protein IE53DRAFT_50 [Violaceomyces palustris]|uniref:Uncharacterized protein n=1 Tax=Violaceomyces palustris TaxID=1673888 RepID=A0ACD0P8K7_9BASI|nr:hypothetical protein IE53DRAFT_50 [Violaceomyces palustris]
MQERSKVEGGEEEQLQSPKGSVSGNTVEEPASSESGDDVTANDDVEEDSSIPLPPPPGMQDPVSVSKSFETLRKCLVLEAANQSNGVKPLVFSNLMQDVEKLSSIVDCVAAIGSEMCGEFVFFV